MNATDNPVVPDPDDDDPFSPTWRYGPLFDSMIEEAAAAHDHRQERFVGVKVEAVAGRVEFTNGTGTELIDLAPDEAVRLGVALIQAASEAIR